VRKTSWGPWSPSHPPPALTKHPYRHAAIAHGVLAVVILGFGWATSSHVGRTVLMALGYFVVATSWTWWRYRERERREGAAGEAK
jgi:hypothetical protein